MKYLHVKSFFVAVIALITLFAFEVSWANVSVSPAIVSVDIKKGRPSGRFEISNTGEEEQRYRVLATHFEQTASGGLNVIPPDENSLAPWIKFNPREFTLPPKSRKVIRYVIAPRGKLDKKTYWAAMELESLKSKEYKSPKMEDGNQYSVQVVPSLLVPMFATVGKLHYEGKIFGSRVLTTENGPQLQIDIANHGEGNLALRGTYQVLKQARPPMIGEEVIAEDKLGSGLILPNAKRRMKTLIPGKELTPGQYTVRASYTAEGLESALAKDLTFVWK